MNVFIEDVNISDFSELLVSLPMFRDLNNVDELKSLFNNVLKDLYQVIPEEVLNFLKNKPSKKFLTLYFMQHGIDDKITKLIPDDYKTKIIYILQQLFEVRGTIQVYPFLARILEDITGDMNFYNVVVEETDEYKNNKFKVPRIIKIEYLETDAKILESIALASGTPDVDGYRPIEEYYAKGYDHLYDPTLGISFDYTRMKKITTLKLRIKAWYQLRFTLAPTDEQIALGITEETTIILPSLSLSTKYEEDLSIFDSQKHGTKQFVYKLKPLYIMDDRNLLTKIDTDFTTKKYFMKLEQYIQRTAKAAKKNIFPVNTNVLYIQYNSGEDLFDTMKIFPDLIRMYSMTALQNETFYINIGSYSGRIPLRDYMDILSYIKIQEVRYKNPGWDFNTQVQRFDPVLNKYIDISTYYSYFQYPLDILPDIDLLLKDYNDMLLNTKDVYVLDSQDGTEILKRISPYAQYHDFKNRFQYLMSRQENIKLNDIINNADFKEKLSGNLPTLVSSLIEMLSDFIIEKYPTDEVTSTRLIQELNFIKDEWSIGDDEVQNYINLLLNYSVTNYELFKQKIIIKYPRLIQEIDRVSVQANEFDSTDPDSVPIGAKAYFYLFLQLYKQVEPDIIKRNDYIKYFFRDTFSRLLMGNIFKNEFFDPIINLFENYFFNIDQSYLNSDIQTYRVKDKMNFIPVDSRIKHNLDVPKFSRNFYARSRHGLYAYKQISDQISPSDRVDLTITRDGIIRDLVDAETIP